MSRGLHLQSTTDIGNALKLIEELLSGVQLVDNLFAGLELAVHGASPDKA